MSNDKENEPIQYVTIGDEVVTCYDSFNAIDLGTKSPMVVVRVGNKETGDDRTVIVEERLVLFPVVTPKEMSLQEFERQKRIALGLEVISGISIPGTNQKIPHIEDFVVIDPLYGKVLYGLIEINLGTKMAQVVRYYPETGGASAIIEISIAAYEKLKKESRKQAKNLREEADKILEKRSKSDSASYPGIA